MNQSQILRRIALADRHLAEAEERISQQRVRVVSSIGAQGVRAEAVLNTYMEIRQQMQVHRSILEEEMRLCEVPR